MTGHYRQLTVYYIQVVYSRPARFTGGLKTLVTRLDSL